MLVTGASSGVGLAAAQGLAARGANLWLLCRDAQRGEAALDSCRRTSGSGRLELLLADLASQDEIRSVAAEFLGQNEPLHVLVNNAAGVFFERTETVDGIESTLAVNHVAPFLLTHLLLPRLLESAPARVINVASAGHRTGRIRIDDLGCRVHSYQGLVQYSHTKLANVLFSNELARRLEGSQVTSNALHPGGIQTDIMRDNNFLIRWITRLMFKPVTEGAKTSVMLASDPELAGVSGRYFDQCEEKPPGGKALDPELADRLWKHSAELVGMD